MLELMISFVMIYLIYVAWIYVVALLWGNSDVKSVLQVAWIFLAISFAINLLGIHLIFAFGIMGVTSIFLFMKFFDYEPMPALMSGFLFWAVTNVLIVLIVGV